MVWCVIFMTIFNGAVAQIETQDICEDTIITVPVESVTNNLERLGLLEDTRGELIKKCLNHLAESIADDDMEKVYNLKEYALTLEDSVYLPLMPRDLWLIDLYLNRFDDFLNDIVALDSAREAELAPKIIFRTNLYYAVHKQVSSNLDAIKQSANADSRLTDTDKDFIDVFLKQFVTNPNNYVNIMNRESSQFLQNHPDSKYDYYVKQNLSLKFIMDPDGFQLDCALGGGVNILSGGMTDWFDMGNGSIQMGIRFGVKRWEVSWQFIGMFENKPKKDIHFSNGAVWEKGKGWNAISNQFCFGRIIPLNEKWTFVPRVGVGYTEFIAPQDHDNKENPLNDQRLISFMPIVGAEISYDKFFFDNSTPGFWGPALRLSVQPIKTKIEGETIYGATTTLSLVVKFGLCEAKRVY